MRLRSATCELDLDEGRSDVWGTGTYLAGTLIYTLSSLVMRPREAYRRPHTVPDDAILHI